MRKTIIAPAFAVPHQHRMASLPAGFTHNLLFFWSDRFARWSLAWPILFLSSGLTKIMDTDKIQNELQEQEEKSC